MTTLTMSRIVLAIGALGALGTALALVGGLLFVEGNEALGSHTVAALVGLLASLFCHVWLGIFFLGSALAARGGSTEAAASARRLLLPVLGQVIVVLGISFVAFWSGYAAYTRDVSSAQHLWLGALALALQAVALVGGWRASSSLDRELTGLAPSVG